MCDADEFYSMLLRRGVAVGSGREGEWVCKDVSLSSVSSVRFFHNNGTVVNPAESQGGTGQILKGTVKRSRPPLSMFMYICV